MTAIERPSGNQGFGGWVRAGWASIQQPVDIASLAVFRILFGLLNLVSVIRFFAYDWIDQLYIAPSFHFKYWGFSWVQPLPGAGMYLHFAVLGVLSIGVMVGLWYRVSIALFALAFTWIELIEKATYLNHYYFLSIVSVLMIFMPLEKAASVDAWRRPEIRRDVAPGLVLWTLRLQLGIVYFFAGVAKLKPDWLLEAQPLRIWLAANAEFPVLGPLFGRTWVAYVFSWAGAAFDLSVFFLLLWGRSRPFAYAAVAVFHVVTWKLFNIGMFPWIMIASTLLFFPPDWPRRWLPAGVLRRLGLARRPDLPSVEAEAVRQPGLSPMKAEAAREPGLSPMETDAAQEPGPSPMEAEAARERLRPQGWRGRLVLGALAVHFSIQLLMPLRHLLYPGDVCWTEEGFRFAWNVMLVEKSGQVDFQVLEPSTGKTWTVSPREHLTLLQAKMMATQPDMMLEFAHYLADDFRRRGHPVVEVRATSFVAYNGRSRQALIDPRVDLAREQDGLRHKSWIVPLGEGDRFRSELRSRR